MKKILSIAVATALTCGVAMAKEVKVGVIMPMSGPIGGFGQSAMEGLELMNEMAPTLKNGDSVKDRKSVV